MNGKQFPNEGLLLGMDHENNRLRHRTLFEASGIHHLNAGLQKTHDMYINVYFMLLFDLTPTEARLKVIRPFRERQYQDQVEILQALTRSYQVPTVPLL